MIKAADMVNKALNVANNVKTLYVLGGWGQELGTGTDPWCVKHYEYNQQEKRIQKIHAASRKTYGFDCVCFLKGLMWGFGTDMNKTCGGAVYTSNGVPDIGADTMFSKCTEQSTDFTKIVPGEFCWMKGHIGIYVGDGLSVECTPNWKDGVQITACNCKKDGYPTRTWTKHGKSPYLDYSETVKPAETTQTTLGFTKQDVLNWMENIRKYIETT